MVLNSTHLEPKIYCQVRKRPRAGQDVWCANAHTHEGTHSCCLEDVVSRWEGCQKPATGRLGPRTPWMLWCNDIPQNVVV